MGNSLSATNPSEILPVESYINDTVNDDDCIESLGSTRFMKVARARTTTDGYQVLKVFLLQEEERILEPYRNEILYIRDVMSSAPNCCVLRKILKKPKYAVLCRPYQKCTLYDRLSTRPFIVETERLWYIYQIFRGLAQMQEQGVCHGDLKSQNILISSSNWLQITDFASFKPCFLPIDNPSSFTFFFDTSRRQSCYVAPERFSNASEYERVETKFPKGSSQYSALRPSMDMFSAGCVIFELLCDGRAPFSYGELCEYRAMDNPQAARFLEKLLENVTPPFRSLLKLLLARECSVRPTARQVLTDFASLFPPIFDSFVFNYLNGFRPKDVTSSVSIEDLDVNHKILSLEPDDVVFKLLDHEKMLIDRLSSGESSRQVTLLFISLLTSNIRALRTLPAKVDAMKLLINFSRLTGTSIATERVLPYLVHFAMSDLDTQVRGAAIHAIVDLLEPLEPSTIEDSMIFIDYLLPKFQSIAQDPRSDTFLLCALAMNLGKIAQTAMKFQRIGRTLRGDDLDDETSAAETINDACFNAMESLDLSHSVHDVFMQLAGREPKNSPVRHTLVNADSLQKLYCFFDDSNKNWKAQRSAVLKKHPLKYDKSSDEYDPDPRFLLSYIVTFLNEKQDGPLRVMFFDSLAICAPRGGVDAVLLEQGLHDFEEMVVMRTINCISVVLERNVLNRSTIDQLIKDIIPFLAHPNDWIRSGVVNVLTILDSKWSVADVHCKLIPRVNEYTKEKMIRLNNKTALMHFLNEPIRRDLWRKVMELDVEKTKRFCKVLDECSIRRMDCDVISPDPAFSKLFDLGLKDKRTLQYMANFQYILPKMAEFRQTLGMEKFLTFHGGVIDLTSWTAESKVHELGSSVGGSMHSRIGGIQESREYTSDSREMRSSAAMQNSQLMRTSFCEAAKNALLTHKNDVYRRTTAQRRNSYKVSSSSTSGIRGQLITHLHEHSKKVNQLSIHPNGERFASGSADGTIKIWRSSQASGDCLGAVHSERTITYNTAHSILGLGWTGDGRSLCCSTSDRRILWIDAESEKIKSKVEFPEVDGTPDQIHLSGPCTYVRTHHGTIYCLDSRIGESGGLLKSHEAWRREVSSSHGLVTSFAIDPERDNWMALTATNSVVLLWDLRYPLEVNNWKSEHKIVPLHVWTLPFMPSARERTGEFFPEIMVGYASRGEVSGYQLHTGSRSRVLWPSLKPRTVHHSATKEVEDDRMNVTTSLSACPDSEFIYTGDSQGALRRWSLRKPQNCEYLSGPKRPDSEFLSNNRVVYETDMIESRIPVLCEKRVENQGRRGSRVVAAGETKVSWCHRTAISDVCLLPGDLLASSSADGVIKIWK